MIKVSIIIPYKEDRGFLKEALNSIDIQTYPHNLIEVKESQSPGNLSHNINNGLQLIGGDLVKILSEDDFLTPNSIADSVEGFENGCDFIHGNAYVFRNGRNTPHYAKIHHPTKNDLLGFSFFIHGATTMFKTELFDQIGLFDESLTTAEELDFYFRCFAAGKKIGYVNSFLAHYRIHPKQKSMGVDVDQVARKEKRIAVREKYR